MALMPLRPAGFSEQLSELRKIINVDGVIS